MDSWLIIKLSLLGGGFWELADLRNPSGLYLWETDTKKNVNGGRKRLLSPELENPRTWESGRTLGINQPNPWETEVQRGESIGQRSQSWWLSSRGGITIRPDDSAFTTVYSSWKWFGLIAVKKARVIGKQSKQEKKRVRFLNLVFPEKTFRGCSSFDRPCIPPAIFRLLFSFLVTYSSAEGFGTFLP